MLEKGIWQKIRVHLFTNGTIRIFYKGTFMLLLIFVPFSVSGHKATNQNILIESDRKSGLTKRLSTQATLYVRFEEESPLQNGAAPKDEVGENREEVEELALIEQIRGDRRKTDLLAYLEQFSDGQYTEEVQGYLDDVLWTAVRTATEEAARQAAATDYLGHLPTGPHAGAATRTLEELALIEQIRGDRHKTDLLAYLEQFSDGQYTEEVQGYLDDVLWTAVRTATEEPARQAAATDYLGHLPTGPHAGAATRTLEELALIEQIRGDRHKTDLLAYLEQFSDGQYTEEVQGYLDDVLWTAVRTATEEPARQAAATDYLGHLPTGPHAGAATRTLEELALIEQIRGDRRKTDLLAYLEQFSDGQYTEEVQGYLDDVLWTAVRTATEEAARQAAATDYLGHLPTGPHAGAATRTLEELALIEQIRGDRRKTDLLAYLEQFSDGQYTEEVQGYLDDVLWTAVRTATEEAARQAAATDYLGHLPTGPHAGAATRTLEELALIEQIRGDRHKTDLLAYLEQFSDGQYTEEVQGYLDDVLWTAVRTATEEPARQAAATDYLGHLPTGPHAGAATRTLEELALIEQIRGDRRKTDLLAYLEQFSDGQYTEEVRGYLEDVLWNGIREAHRNKVIKDLISEYASLFPNGKYAKQLKKDQSDFRTVAKKDRYEAYAAFVVNNSDNVYKRVANYRTTLEYWEKRKRTAHVFSQIGDIYFLEEGKKQRARESYKKALRIEPNHSDAYTGLGRISFKEGHDPQAKHYLEKAVKSKNSASYSAYYLLGRIFEKQSARRSIRWYEKALTLNPECIPCHYYNGVQLLTVLNRSAALKHFQRILSINSENNGDLSFYVNSAKRYVKKLEAH